MHRADPARAELLPYGINIRGALYGPPHVGAWGRRGRSPNPFEAQRSGFKWERPIPPVRGKCPAGTKGVGSSLSFSGPPLPVIDSHSGAGGRGAEAPSRRAGAAPTRSICGGHQARRTRPEGGPLTVKRARLWTKDAPRNAGERRAGDSEPPTGAAHGAWELPS